MRSEKRLGKSQKVFSRGCLQLFLSFLINLGRKFKFKPLKFSKEAEEFTQKMSFHSIKAAGTLPKSTCCCFPAASCTSWSQTQWAGTIRKSALHGSHHGRAMEILTKALPVLCLPNGMFKEQCSTGCALLQIGASHLCIPVENCFSLNSKSRVWGHGGETNFLRD